MTQISVEGPPITPNQMRLTESMLNALHPAGDLFDNLGFRFGLERFIDGIAACISTLTPETPADETRAASD